MRRPRMNEIDVGIIELLRRDGRMSNRDIARSLETSEVTVRKRLRNLLENGTLRVTADLDAQEVGYTHDVIVTLKVDPAHVEEVAAGLAKIPEVRYVAITSGAYDILFAVLAKDTKDVLSFLITKLSTFDGILSTNTTFTLEVVKETFDWPLDIERQPKRRTSNRGSAAHGNGSTGSTGRTAVAAAGGKKKKS